MRNDEAAPQGGPDDLHSQRNPEQGEHGTLDRTTVWIEQRGLKIKLVAGTTPDELDDLIATARAAMVRLSGSGPGGQSAEHAEQAARALPARQRIEKLLGAGPLSGRQLAQHLDLKADTVRVALSRSAAAGRVSMDSDSRWHLIPYRDPRASTGLVERYVASVEGTDEL